MTCIHPEYALASAVQIPEEIGRAVAPLSPPRQSVQALAVMSLPAVLSLLSPPERRIPPAALLSRPRRARVGARPAAQPHRR